MQAGVVGEIAASRDLSGRVLSLAEIIKDKSKMGVFALLRLEHGFAFRELQSISHVHSRDVSKQPKAKL